MAEAAHLTTGAVTAVVGHLEASWLFRRVRDSVDRRRAFIEPTEGMARRSTIVYGPLVAENAQVLEAFDLDQLAVITEFVRRERGLLTRHAARVHETLAAQRATPERQDRED